MLLNTFVSVRPLLEEKKFSIDYDAVVQFLSRYHSGQFIYPNAMRRELKCDIRIAYEILELCRENELLKPCLEIYCPYCQRFTGDIYEVIGDIPEEVGCVHCDNVVENPLAHAIVIYEVL